MSKKDWQYFRKCLASSGEISIYDKQTNQTTTYTNRDGRLIMKSDSGRCVGDEAAIAFLSSQKSPFTRATVTKEGETCINTEFLNYLNQIEKSQIEKA